MPLVQIPAGVYSSFAFQSNTDYQGAGVGKTIIRNASPAAFAHTAVLHSLSNINISGITFDGNGIEFDKCTNLAMRDFEVVNAKRTNSNHQALYFGGMTNCLFERFSIRDCTQIAQGYGGSNIVFQDWKAERLGYGFKWNVSGLAGGKIRRFVLDHLRATQGIEAQGDGAQAYNFYIGDGAYINPELWENDLNNRNGNATAFGNPASITNGTVVERCYADGNAWLVNDAGQLTGQRRVSTLAWRGLRIGAEVGGNNPDWRFNWFVNLNDPGAVTTSRNAYCHDNRVENCIEGWDNASGAIGARYENNGPNVQLPAQGGWSLVGVSAPGNPDPIPPDPVDPCADVKKQLAAANARNAALQAKIDGALLDVRAAEGKLS